jgi:hypothetical protein
MARPVVFALVLVAASHLLADAPLRPPAKYTACSPSQAFCAVADPGTHSVAVFARGAVKPIWSLPTWQRQVFLANDGNHMVIGPPGLNLLSLDAKPSDPLLTFMNRNAVVRIVTVGELFPGMSSLRRTASHYAWGDIVGISAHDQLIVQLEGGRRVAFSVLTGLKEAEK